jgi:hypothetical protein
MALDATLPFYNQNKIRFESKEQIHYGFATTTRGPANKAATMNTACSIFRTTDLLLFGIVVYLRLLKIQKVDSSQNIPFTVFESKNQFNHLDNEKEDE